MVERRKGFFPAWGVDGDLDGIVARWYTLQLQALQEPSLFAASHDPDLHCYRFLWLRTFDRPIALRLVCKENGGNELIAKKCDGKGGSEPGKLIVDLKGGVNAEDGLEFVMRLAEADFWNAQPSERNEFFENGNWGRAFSTDGARWIFEGVAGGRYQIVSRSNLKSGPFRNVALFLLKLSKIRIGNVY